MTANATAVQRPDRVSAGRRWDTNVSLRLTASLATRLYPVLMRDGRRMAEAQRCRASRAPRVAVLRAVATGGWLSASDAAGSLDAVMWAADSAKLTGNARRCRILRRSP